MARVRLALALGLGCLALFAPSAHAATASVVIGYYPDPTGDGCSRYMMCEYRNVVVVAGAGEANALTVTATADGITIRDAGAPLSAGTGCTAAPDGVICPLHGVRVRAGDGNDSVSVSGSVGAEVRGGPGGDVLTGGAGWDHLLGGGGADRLDGGAGSDLLRGGAGTDQILGRSGPDRIYARDGDPDRVHGGRGRDRARVDANLDVVRSARRTIAP